jgi:hypothetical protein
MRQQLSKNLLKAGVETVEDAAITFSVPVSEVALHLENTHL